MHYFFRSLPLNRALILYFLKQSKFPEKYVHIYKRIRYKKKLKFASNSEKTHNHTNFNKESTVASCIYLPLKNKREKIRKKYPNANVGDNRNENIVLEDDSSRCYAAFSRQVVFIARSRSIPSDTYFL
jgi:hypothetical protein